VDDDALANPSGFIAGHEDLTLEEMLHDHWILSLSIDSRCIEVEHSEVVDGDIEVDQ
jgi:hypothetical protein